MVRPALILAALAADAAPGVNFSTFRVNTQREGLDSLLLWDKAGASYEFLLPSGPAGVRELALELRVLSTLGPHLEELPFDTAKKIGETSDETGVKGVLLTFLAGVSPELGKLGPGEFTQSFAKSVAAIHAIPLSAVRDAGLPDYDSAAVLHRKVSELDRMAATGRIPADLLGRWERALEDVSLFRFHSTVVHGGLNSDSVLLSGQRVVAITGWANLKISDPAEDLSWLVQSALDNTQEDALLHYRSERMGTDENILQRATLYAEMEIGLWMVYCLNQGDEKEIENAEDLLAGLRADLDAGLLRDLKASSFVGLGATTSLLPEITRVNTGAIEIIEIAEPLSADEPEQDLAEPDLAEPELETESIEIAEDSAAKKTKDEPAADELF